MPTSKQKKGRDDAMAEILATIHDSQRVRLETAKHDLKTRIIPRLEQLGIAAVQATYSGYGDSGSIQTIDYLDATHKPVDIERVAPTITPEVERVLYQSCQTDSRSTKAGKATSRSTFGKVSCGSSTKRTKRRRTTPPRSSRSDAPKIIASAVPLFHTDSEAPLSGLTTEPGDDNRLAKSADVVVTITD